jgi:hypothetical protein
MTETPANPVVMISSTIRDLPAHREKVMDACLRVGLMPKMMEHLPPSSDDAIKASLDMVDEADIYLGIFAFRYGYVPDGHEKSITEMEYDRAKEREMERLIFLMGDDHAVKPSDVEKGAGGEKVDALRDRLQKEQVVGFFDSPENLRTLAVHALAEAKDRLEDEPADPVARSAASMLYVSAIPQPPEPLIAHPYTLLREDSMSNPEPPPPSVPFRPEMKSPG